MMAETGINTVRTYTVPPAYLFDIAEKNNLSLMVGLPWEQHITFLDDASRQEDIINRVREAAKSCNNHPSISACSAIESSIARAASGPSRG